MFISRRAAITLSCFITVSFLLGSSHSRANEMLPSAKHGNYSEIIQWAGGIGEGFTLVQVRWGGHKDYERLVLEFRAVKGLESSHEWPRMDVGSEDYPARLRISLPGSPGMARDLYPNADPVTKSRLIAGLNFYDSCGELSLNIIPSMPVIYEIFGLTSPTRLVVDIKKSRAIPPDIRKYSLRTLPLFGDQQCRFLEEAKRSRIPARLLTDSSGTVIGEAGLFPDPDEAFAEKEKLAEFRKKFSLIVKMRGPFDIPSEF